MVLERKVMSRSNWPRVIDREYVHMMGNEYDFNGAIGLIYLKNVTEPATKTYDKTRVTIIDSGYYWLQIAPKGENFWLTVMYNQLGEIVQFYYDITDCNTILENGESWFYDLYLDIVMLPDGRLFLLDEDEICRALDKKDITKDQYDKAYLTANEIIKKLDGNIGDLTDTCNHYFEILKRKICL